MHFGASGKAPCTYVPLGLRTYCQLCRSAESDVAQEVGTVPDFPHPGRHHLYVGKILPLIELKKRDWRRYLRLHENLEKS